MTSGADKHAHRKNLTFRQAEGRDPLPEMLAYGELSVQLRNRIWDVLHGYLSTHILRPEYNYNSFSDEAQLIGCMYLRHFLSIPIDEARKRVGDVEGFLSTLKENVFKANYCDCLGAVQHFLQANGLPPTWTLYLANVFNDPTSPYMVVDFPPKVIVPRGDENERKAFEQNWSLIKTSALDNAKTHLRQSAEALNAGDARGTIREAITAVEGAAIIVTGKAKATLGDALKVLERDKGLNGVLSTAFSKLYGYSSNEKGIRHALMDGDNANVGQDEALFMFSACTAFVAYLARKYPENV